MKVFRSNKGFTLIEIMIVVLIIGILLSIAVPSFLRARETSRAKTCVSNLKQIEAAKEQWAMDEKKVAADVPAWADLAGTGKYMKTQPSCPSAGTYTIGAISADPVCSIGANGTGTYDDHQF
jgi:prepilin-type N-terminal cleavage/methylation domain-containing protein